MDEAKVSQYEAILGREVLPLYRSQKIVRAALIASVVLTESYTRTEDVSIADITFSDSRFAPRKINLRGKPTPDAGWYMVIYADGYFSFSPSDVFEAGHTQFTEAGNNFFDFQNALSAIKAGLKVAREGWNGAGMFVFLVRGSRFKVNRAPLLGIYPEGTEIDYRPHIDLRTAQGDIVPWAPSQSDILGVDWRIVG